MKIGIMTFNEPTVGNNYGMVLQCFALQWYLRNLGHNAYVIKYERVAIKKKNPTWLRALHALNPVIFFRYFQGKHLKTVLDKERVVFPRSFDDFFTRYVKKSSVTYTDLSELKENPPEADIYIAGSDQIWNAELLGRNEQMIRSYFLDFGSDNVLRISYAASWGRKDYPEEFVEIAKLLLKRFNLVSVREKTGIDICNQFGYVGAKWVCDPTLLLTADEYRKLYNENPIRRRERKYLLMYILGKKVDVNFCAVINFAKRKGLETVLVYDGLVHVKNVTTVYPTIPEWLYLIDNAEYVITNSFHGSLFSTLFGKKYGSLYARGKGKKGQVRLDSLFEGCKIEPRWLKRGKGFTLLDKPYTADISSFRAESMKFIVEALNMTGGGGKASNRICASLQKAA